MPQTVTTYVDESMIQARPTQGEAIPLDKQRLFAGEVKEVNKLRGLVTRYMLASTPVVGVQTPVLLQHREDCIGEAFLALVERQPGEYEDYEGRVVFGTNLCAKRAVQRYLYRTFAGVDLLNTTDSIEKEGEEGEAYYVEQGTFVQPLAYAIAEDRLQRLLNAIAGYVDKQRGGWRTGEDYVLLLHRALRIEAGIEASPPFDTKGYKVLYKARQIVLNLAAGILAEEDLALRRLLDRERAPRGGASWREVDTGRYSLTPVSRLQRTA